jgi:hypothetical protein
MIKLAYIANPLKEEYEVYRIIFDKFKELVNFEGTFEYIEAEEEFLEEEVRHFLFKENGSGVILGKNFISHSKKFIDNTDKSVMYNDNIDFITKDKDDNTKLFGKNMGVYAFIFIINSSKKDPERDILILGSNDLSKTVITSIFGIDNVNSVTVATADRNKAVKMLSCFDIAAEGMQIVTFTSMEKSIKNANIVINCTDSIDTKRYKKQFLHNKKAIFIDTALDYKSLSSFTKELNSFGIKKTVSPHCLTISHINGILVDLEVMDKNNDVKIEVLDYLFTFNKTGSKVSKPVD